MARRLRLQFPGGMYHVINRGNYRQAIFATPGAAMAFDRVLGECCQQFGWVVHAFATMRNHFHLALTTPTPTLEQGMHWLQSTFAIRFNRFRSESGHLFQGRYQSPLIEDAAALTRVVDYIHLNPLRAGLVPPERLDTFCWGSLKRFVHGRRPDWLSPCEWLSQAGIDDSAAGWRAYIDRLVSIAAAPSEDEERQFNDIARGRPIGTQSWKRELARAYRHRALDVDVPHEEILPLRQARWSEALAHALSIHGVTAAELKPTPRLPRWKVEIAAYVRSASGAPYRWIGDQLSVKNPASLRAAVCWHGRR